MGKRNEYMIGETTITKSAAANFIADALFPGRMRRSAYKLIHSRIDEAQSKAILPQQTAMPADVFFGWAITQSGWERLREIPGISISSNVHIVGVAASTQVGGDVSGVPSSSNVGELTIDHVQTVQQLEAAKRELAKLQSEISADRQKKEALTAIRRESGKQGGRGNEK